MYGVGHSSPCSTSLYALIDAQRRIYLFIYLNLILVSACFHSEVFHVLYFPSDILDITLQVSFCRPYNINVTVISVGRCVRVAAGIAQSVKRLATGWTVWRSNPGGGEIFRTRPDRLWGPPRLLYIGYRVFPGGKAARAWC